MVVLSNSTPMVTTRVLYIGSAVPLDTVTGLDAVQGPLKERYPVDNESDIEGIDANLSVTDSCIQMQYINDADSIVQFPISSLTLCAAVRCVSTTNSASGEKSSKFVSLNDPLAGGANSTRPTIFTAVTRRTQGRKVLECHGFICASPRDAMNLVKYASIAGKNYKQRNGTLKQAQPTTVITQQQNGTVQATVVERDPLIDFGATSSNRISTDSSVLATSTLNKSTTIPNGGGVQNGTPAMRLIPAEPITQVAAGPEFFEPVSTQGYFYSSDKADVKKYNIERLNRHEDKPPAPTVTPVPDQTVLNGTVQRTPSVVNGYSAAPTPRPAPERAKAAPPPPIYVRLPRQYGPPMQPYSPRPMFYGPPPPPHFMPVRPRFFSPPPPRFRPQPFMMPPGAPPPMSGAPIFVRRPRPPSDGSRSRSPSTDSQRSKGSRSKTPTPGDVNDPEETTPKERIPNADESSDESVRVANRQRPSTPPTDYDDRHKRERMSRRDAYEVRYGVAPPPRYGPPPEFISPYGNDYYVYPPRHGGYAPFPLFNPHTRARSLPNHGRQKSQSPKRKGKKSKKSKKNKNKKGKQPPSQPLYGPSNPYPRQTRDARDGDVSTDSYGGYHSEIPLRSTRPVDPTSGYQFYPPRDFRRNENQFMNERHFSKSMAESSRRSHDLDAKPYPTAYELNDALNQGRTDEVDFNMY
ncbi:hypothetical protein ACF0H5_017242 [Mactra antiquata]